MPLSALARITQNLAVCGIPLLALTVRAGNVSRYSSVGAVTIAMFDTSRLTTGGRRS